jgi:hypothetical protein
MKRLKIFTVAMLLTGCTAQAQNSIVPPSPTISPSPIEPINRTGRFKLNLTLTAPEDLKVKEGDTVLVGQTLSDRTRERQRLEAQKAQVEIQIQRLNQAPIKPIAPKRIPDVAALPAPSFLEEVAAVEQQVLREEQQRRDLMQQQRKLDVIAGMPQGDVPPSTLSHESEVLSQRERNLKQAESESDLTKAKLEKAKRDYQREEYQYSLELSKREIDIQRQQQEYQRQQQEWEKQDRDRTFQLSQVSIQLQNLDTQLNQISVVKAPYAGKVQRIRWNGQNDKNLSVELTLITADLRTRPGANQTAPSPESANGQDRKTSSPGTSQTFNTDRFAR